MCFYQIEVSSDLKHKEAALRKVELDLAAPEESVRYHLHSFVARSRQHPYEYCSFYKDPISKDWNRYSYQASASLGAMTSIPEDIEVIVLVYTQDSKLYKLLDIDCLKPHGFGYGSSCGVSFVLLRRVKDFKEKTMDLTSTPATKRALSPTRTISPVPHRPISKIKYDEIAVFDK